MVHSIPDILFTISDDIENENDYIQKSSLDQWSKTNASSIIDFESKMSNVHVYLCKMCFKTSLNLKLNKSDICQSCEKSKIHSINNNILPVWYFNEDPQMYVPN